MSSSENLERPIFRDLSEGTPPTREPQFVQTSTFDDVGRNAEPPVSAETAYRSGLAEGEARGREAARLELLPALEQFKTMTLTVSSAREALIEDARQELIEVAGALARNLLRGELAQGGDVVLRMARACIDEAKRDGAVVGLHVSPGDAELVRTHVPELEVDLQQGAIRVLPDPALEPGGVVIETERACYEGRPERLLEATLRRETQA